MPPELARPQSSTRPKVAVGIPVCNGESDIRACLDCLTAQTYQEISILVFDNASTDRTAEIVKEAMRSDARIQYFQHPSNIGALANFSAALAAAEAPYFMWRAYDDLSDPMYIEHLVAALEAQPDAILAAPRTETLRTTTGRLRVRPPPEPKSASESQFASERRLIRRLQAGWFYGLYRREPLTNIMSFVQREYHFVWAWDYLVLIAIALRGNIVGVPAATFVHRLTPAPKQYSASKGSAERMALLENYWQVIELLLSDRSLSPYQMAMHRLTCIRHVRRRVANWPALLHLAQIRFLGQ